SRAAAGFAVGLQHVSRELKGETSNSNLQTFTETPNSKFQIPSHDPMADLAQTVMERIEALGEISEEQGRLTRTYGSPAMRRANELAGSWMREAEMETRQDAVGNLIGHYARRGQETGDRSQEKA